MDIEEAFHDVPVLEHVLITKTELPFNGYRVIVPSVEAWNTFWLIRYFLPAPKGSPEQFRKIGIDRDVRISTRGGSGAINDLYHHCYAVCERRDDERPHQISLISESGESLSVDLDWTHI